MPDHIFLQGQKVGKGCPCYVIAEIGSNHNRDIGTAKKLIDAAKEAGCDAVKFQSYTAEGLYSVYTPRPSEIEGRSHPGERLYDLIKRIEMPVAWHRPLKEYCDQAGISFCSTPFDEGMVDVLEQVQVPFYKVASFEITHYPMLRRIARTGKPVILATGNSGLDDIERAVACLKDAGCSDLALLHCVSQYPAREEDMNLRCMATLVQAFDCVVGLSDHTTNSLSAALSIVLGAAIIEKHITLDKAAFGPDHPFALEPDELKELVTTVRRSERILGSAVKAVRSSEAENHKIGRRSLVAARDIAAGELLTEDKIAVKRPAFGLHPKYLPVLEGKRLVRDIKKDQWLTWDHFLNGKDNDVS